MFKLDNVEEWMLHHYGHNGEDERTRYGEYAQLGIYAPNTPDIVERGLRAANATQRSELALHQYMSFMRHPQGLFYTVALNIVWPKTIVELGIGGDMGISTSIFLHWCEQVGGKLYSCDRNPPAWTGVRYAPYVESGLWVHEQCCSLEFLAGNTIPKPADMVFIDTIHTFDHTMKELAAAAEITNVMLMDDAEYVGYMDGIDGNILEVSPIDRADIQASELGGVKRAIAIWLREHPEWEKVNTGMGNVALLLRQE